MAEELVPLVARGEVRALRPRLDPAARRRLARLSRRAHRFHQFAHHPLCGRYAGEVIRIGRRTRVCRGCAFALLGGLAGGAAALGAWLAESTVSPWLALAAAVALLVPTVLSKRRVPKLASRLVPAALFAFALSASVLARAPLPALATVAAVGALRLAYGRRGGDRTPCETCPERDDAPCSGFAPIVLRERAFQRATRR